MRENFVPLLEAHGVDLVLCGHSHNYERSCLLYGHYGYSDSLTAAMRLNAGDGRCEDTGPYTKPFVGPGANQGAVYAVVGCSGQATFQQFDWPHPVMAFAETQLGSLVIDVDGNVLDARFLRETGAVDDYFTIVKSDGEFRITSVRTDEARGIVRLTWNTLPGRYYRLYRRWSLDPQESWVLVADGIYAEGTSLCWNDPVDPFLPASFFRVEQVPN